MLTRRQLLRAGGLVACAPCVAAAPATATALPPLRLLQPLDPAADQQEQVRDYAAGLQLALQVANKAGGVGGREVQVPSMPVDASPAGAGAVQQRLRSDSGLLGLVGCAGERLSLALIASLTRTDPGVSHVAPWLPDARHDGLPQVLNLFASREEQVRHSLASLQAMGLRQIGVVYDGEATRSTVQASLDATLQHLALRLPSWTAPARGARKALAAAPRSRVRRAGLVRSWMLGLAEGLLSFRELKSLCMGLGMRWDDAEPGPQR